LRLLAEEARLAVAMVAPVPIALKDVSRGDDVTQADLYAMRARVRELMRLYYTVWPGDFALGAENADEAFAFGLRYDGSGKLIEPSLMSGIGRNGFFTKVPGEYVAGGQTITEPGCRRACSVMEGPVPPGPQRLFSSIMGQGGATRSNAGR